jgi:hypothetical protein
MKPFLTLLLLLACVEAWGQTLGYLSSSTSGSLTVQTNLTSSGTTTLTGVTTAGTVNASSLGTSPLGSANLTGSHTLPDGTLSTNVPLLNANQTFGGANTFTGATAQNSVTAENVTTSNYTAQAIGTLAIASTTNAVVDFHNPDVESITLTANLNLIQTTNRTASVSAKHLLWLYPNGTNRTVTFNSSWHTNGFFSTTITLTNTTVASVVFSCNGSAETNVFAVYTTWP